MSKIDKSPQTETAKAYTVLSPVATDHVCEVGEVIELDDRNAAELLAIGAIAPVAAA